MLDSDTGSSDLSEAASLSSDNSSGSEADVTEKRQQLAKPRVQQRQRSGHTLDFGPSEILSSSDSDNGGYSSSEQKMVNINAPISLSASQSVYSKELMDRSMMLSPANASYNPQLAASVSSRGRGRGRGKASLTGRGSRKYGSAGATVIDFEDLSTQGEELEAQESVVPTASALIPVPRATISNTERKKKKSSEEHSKAKLSKGSTGSNIKQKSGTKKTGNPKSVPKDVYCICREPYDGVEFMIACDRCEEWFHGRCIGMKPQEAKKSSHYYCDTCQRIRRMLGVSTSTDEHTKPAKAKARSKKNAEKQSKLQIHPAEAPDMNDKLPPLKIKAVFGSKNSSNSDVTISNPSTDHITARNPNHAAPYPKTNSTLYQSHTPESFTTPGHTQSQDTQKQKSNSQPGFNSTQYDALSITGTQTASVSPSYVRDGTLSQVSDTIRSASFAEEEEEEDVCPVCDFQCTCNNNGSSSSNLGTKPTTTHAQVMDDPHSFTAIKVPFQPGTSSSGHGSSYPDAEKRPVIPVNVVDTTHDNPFRTSLKNPMSTPSHQGQSNVARRGGKATAKTPFLMHRVKSKYSYRGHDRKYDEVGYGSDLSGISDDEDSDGKGHVGPRARYESDSDDVDNPEDTLSLSSSDSSSDLDKSSTRPTLDMISHHISGNKQSFSNAWVQSRSLASSTSITHPSPSYTISESTFSTKEDSAHNQKQSSRKPRKHKDPLIISPEDEMALYTPAAATRKITSGQTQATEPSKVARIAIRPKDRTGVAYITYDPEVAEDVAALNALEEDSDDEDQVLELVTIPPKEYTEDDIFGDSDLSDELSGELSEIQSEDMDDLSDDTLDFASDGDDEDDDEDDDDDDDGSSPKEFNYSDMEEQDESLVDSDSSANSISAESTNSSDSESDSGMEGYLQDASDMEAENLEFEGSVIDEEELLLLEEQERLFLAKAHGLHDVFSDEDSDPDRNPFESSEDDNEDGDAGEDAEDEMGFDGDGDDDYYSDGYYEEYSDDGVDDVDEQEILAQLQGVQSDMQALMMIPPEQQEQLLLLQHYEETHRQQQAHLVQQHEVLVQAQDEPSQSDQQKYDAHSSSQMDDLLAGSGFLSTFDVGVPDLDAVSEQLAASLAESISAIQGLDGCLFPIPILGEGTLLDEGAAIPKNPTNTPASTSPKAALPASLESSEVAWSAVLPTMSCSLNLVSASISTPASTSTLLAEASGALLSTTTSEVVNQEPSYSAELCHGSSSLLQASAPLTDDGEGSQKMHTSQSNVQSLPNSSLYKPLSSIVVTPISGETSLQSILAKLEPCEDFPDPSQTTDAQAMEPPLYPLNQSRLQNSDPNTFKEAAQKALSMLNGNASKCVSSESSPSGATLEGGLVFSDENNMIMHTAELKKRKDAQAREVPINYGKRRRLSISSSKEDAVLHLAPESQVPMDPVLAPTSDSESTSPMSSSHTSLSVASKPPTPLSITASDLEGLASFSTLESGATSILYDLKGMLPFLDPTLHIVSSSSLHRQVHAPTTHATVRVRRQSLKGKETKQVDVMPMDDLLDTSALYGQSSSRSPSPERAGTGEEGESGMSQAMLKDLNRWERVPIGTFRKSRRPNSPCVGIQGALKPGNGTISATLLADHHQQQLFQASHRHKKTGMIRRHRPSASDVLTTLTGRNSGLANGSGSSRTIRDHLLGSKHHHRPRSSVTSTGISTERNSLIPSTQDPFRRKRRPIGSVDNIRARKSSHVELGPSPHGFTDACLENSKSGFVAGHADRASGLRDLMTDSSQLPSSACPTPLHSPLFSATTASGSVHHHNGEPMLTIDLHGKIGSIHDNDDESREEATVSHLDLDIDKEMDGFK